MNLLRGLFGIDVRALAVFRVGLALILLLDLADRARWLTAHYTDQGVLPRSFYLTAYANDWRWSLHLLSGAAFYQGVLFLVAAAAAVALLVGWRTRVATLVSWVLLFSLQSRNPLLNNSGDVLLRQLLLWSVLLPLGAAWSLDAKRYLSPLAASREGASGEPARDARGVALSIATAGVLLHVACLYVFTALFKFNEVWRTGEGLREALNLDLYARPLGVWLRNQGSLVSAMGKAVVWVELLAPIVVFVPIFTRWVRIVVAVVMVGFHLGIELTLHVGWFSWLCMLAWTLFLPPMVWDAVVRGVSKACGPGEPASSVPAAGSPGFTARVVTNACAAAMLAFVVYLNIQSVSGAGEAGLPDWARATATATGLDQRWSMFANPGGDGWYIIVGTHRSNPQKRTELLTGQPFDETTVQRPERVDSLFPNHRWRKYYKNLIPSKNETLRRHLPMVLCQEWNATQTPEDPIDEIEVNFIEETVGPDGKPTLRRLVFYRGVCPRPDDIVMPPRDDELAF